MIHLRRQILLNAFKLFDILIVAFALLMAAFLNSGRISAMPIGEFISISVEIRTVLSFLFFALAWRVICSLLMLYRSRRLDGRWNEVTTVLGATSLGTVVLFIIACLLRVDMITPNFLSFFWAISSSIIIVSRLLLRRGLSWLRCRGRNLRFVMILGTNRGAVQFAQKIETTPELGFRLVGFIDEEWTGTGEFEKAGYSTMADFRGFPRIIRDRVVDEVWIALPLESYSGQIAEVLAYCRKLGIITRFFPEVFDLESAQLKVEQIGGDSVMTEYPATIGGWPFVVKRVLDICLSIVLLVLLSPLFLAVAILITVTSPGPVLFVQERVGLNRRRFRLYKFRTMIRDAEQRLHEIEHLNEVTGPVFKVRNDPRVTKVGKFLRKTSIDELPQLFSVLKGDMSLVGPRPLPVRDYEGFDQDRHRRRFSVLPGITCLWQVNGRNSVPFDKWMELDLQYIDQWTLWLDFKILLKTIPTVLKGSGAA
ncbi:MAG: sugar transferase [Thermodesulfobacteriota bacterium]|nr:sugar transferase [Thermodesulfobacteriota bacterium]